MAKKPKKLKIRLSRRKGFLPTVLIIAALGTILLVRSLAQTNSPDASKDIVLAYVNSKPTSIQVDTQGNLTYPSISASSVILADGTVVCDDGNATGTVQTTKIGEGLVKQLTGEVGNLQLEDVPKQSAPAGQNIFIDPYEGYYLKTDAVSRAFAVYPGGSKNDKLLRMQNKIQNVCTANAHQAKKRTDTDLRFNFPLSQPKKTAAASTLNKLVASINNQLFGRVSAVVYAPPPPASSPAPAPPPAVYEDTNAEARNLTLLNNWRTSHGRRALTRVSCLDSIAKNWSSYMANSGIVVHQSSADLMSRLKSYCGVSNSMLTGIVAENLGTGGSAITADQMFNSWLGSSGHYSILMDSTIKYVGIGVYVNPSTQAVYYTNDFAAW